MCPPHPLSLVSRCLARFPNTHDRTSTSNLTICPPNHSVYKFGCCPPTRHSVLGPSPCVSEGVIAYPSLTPKPLEIPPPSKVPVQIGPVVRVFSRFSQFPLSFFLTTKMLRKESFLWVYATFLLPRSMNDGLLFFHCCPNCFSF